VSSNLYVDHWQMLFHVVLLCVQIF